MITIWTLYIMLNPYIFRTQLCVLCTICVRGCLPIISSGDYLQVTKLGLL